jgi:hypothetical protein
MSVDLTQHGKHNDDDGTARVPGVGRPRAGNLAGIAGARRARVEAFANGTLATDILRRAEARKFA